MNIVITVWEITVAAAAPFTPNPSNTINIKSKIILHTDEISTAKKGVRLSPIPLKAAEYILKTARKGMPANIILK